MTDGTARSLTFVPGREVTVEPDDEVSVKGGLPAGTRGVLFADVYAMTPVVALDECARLMDSSLFDGKRPGGLARIVAHTRVAPDQAHSDASPTDLEWVGALDRPYRIAECPDHKIAHSLNWIHTNLSRQAGDPAAGDPTAEELFRAYALILKADDYFVARHMTPNGSMTLQRALVQAVMPHRLDLWRASAQRANSTALSTLEGQAGYTDLLRACELSTFAGTTWFALLPTHSPAEDVGGGLGRAYRDEAAWAVDDRASFIDEALRASDLVMVLDDCGEAVFDLDLVQRLLSRNSRLAVTVLARRTVDGSNVTVDDLVRLAGEQALSDLAACLHKGRLRYVAVDQPFPSFEPRFFSDRVREQIAKADVVLVKGAGYFETTLLDRAAYHSFVVHGYSTRLLTGSAPGDGYFRRVTSAADAYSRRWSARPTADDTTA